MNSLRSKITVVFIAVAAASTVTIGLFSYLVTADRLSTELDRTLASAANATAATADDFDGDGRQGRRGGPGDRASSDLVAVQTIDAVGVVVQPDPKLSIPITAADREVASGQSARAEQTVQINGESYRVLTVPLDRGGGAAQAARSIAETERVLDTLRVLILLATLASIALAGVAGWFIARQLTRRLTALTVAAETVGASGRLDVDVPADGSDEVGRLGAAFAGMLAGLNRSRQAQQRLVQDAGHELRTPLTSLRTNIDVLRRHTQLPDAEREQLLEDLDAESHELTSLVNEVVALAGDQAPEEPTTTVALAPLAHGAAERIQRRYGAVITVSADTSVVMGRASQIERAISNLLDNAAKFGAHEPIELDVLAGCVTVTDAGPGFADDDLAQVFERFYRADTARGLPGSGLGLAIVHDVATAHGGTVFAANTATHGARVGFRLPLAPEHA